MNEISKQNEQISWNIPAALKKVDEVCSQVSRFLEAYSLAHEDAFAIQLLLHEALTNAVVHGSARDANKSVTGRLQVHTDEVAIEVNDQGRGFLWKDALAEIPVEMVESGRGLAIYRLYATTYQFNPEGNQVTLHRKRKKESIDGRF